MSGFFGILRSDGQEISSALLERIAKVLRFRGPDGETLWTQPSVGCCFTFLETGPAKQATQQPVMLGSNWILGDMRIDARQDLTRELEQSGAQVSTDATSEDLMLHAWQIWGEGCLEHVIGDFSFALWDHNNRCLWCARDFVGPRPFYYASSNGIFCFSNTLEALRCVPDISSDLDESFIGEFLLRGYCSDLTRTVYSQIRRLAAGHLLKFKNETPEIRRFLTLPIEEPYRFSQPEEYLELYRQVLHEAVADRLPRRPTALYLSGGLDSGSVCAVASRIAGDRGHKNLLKAFTVSWKSLFDDPEPYFAALTANHLGLAHQILEDPDYVPFAATNSLHRPTPEPTDEAFFARSHREFLEIAKHSAIILSGDGGDDVLIGQSWPYLANLWSAGGWPEIVRVIGNFVWRHGKLPPLRAGLRTKLRGLLPSADPLHGYPDWFNPEFEKRNGLREKWCSEKFTMDSTHPIHPRAYNALHKGYWSSVLESEDAGNLFVVSETRAPLLDLRVLRFLLCVPPIPWCVDKELTRHAMSGYLPEAILRRPKTPMVRDPLEECLKSEKWPRMPLEPPTVINGFINWQRWIETLKYTEGYSYGFNFFPLSLSDWLKDVENAQGIE